ncbi:hypothetical protein GE061_012069 [Apolygus lucorum]|uniref:Uncharacterized protein n=1 Tax=Apolygus lucorum TaxID=248454 RepID=A0A8S9XTX6_APOLU|nr:hypothetical protein GE061_012069 [Apolygus lucorum]
MRPYVLFMFACVLSLSAAQSSSERQVRLDDIERDNLKSPQQTPQQQRPVAQYQQYQQAPLVQYTPQFYQVSNAAPSGPGGAQLFAQPSLTPGQLSSYHQQLLFAQPQQLQQPVLIPQHQALPFPVMLIPQSYLLPQQQDVNSLLYGGLPQQYQLQQAKYAPAQAQQIQPTPLKGFRPSPQISAPQYSAQQYQQPQYNAYQTVYQQKYASGAKSTVAPPLKDNYVGQSSNTYSTYKLQ